MEGAEGEVHPSNELLKLLNVTDKLAQKRGDQYISSELFVLAAFEDKGALGRVLKDSGAVKGAVDKAINDLETLKINIGISDCAKVFCEDPACSKNNQRT